MLSVEGVSKCLVVWHARRSFEVFHFLWTMPHLPS